MFILYHFTCLTILFVCCCDFQLEVTTYYFTTKIQQDQEGWE